MQKQVDIFALLFKHEPNTFALATIVLVSSNTVTRSDGVVLERFPVYTIQNTSTDLVYKAPIGNISALTALSDDQRRSRGSQNQLQVVFADQEATNTLNMRMGEQFKILDWKSGYTMEVKTGDEITYLPVPQITSVKRASITLKGSLRTARELRVLPEWRF